MGTPNQTLFAAKLDEMERQYEEMKSRIQICEQENREQIRQELEKAKEGYRQHTKMLQKGVKGSRSEAVAALTQLQLEYGQKMEELRNNGLLNQYMHVEKASQTEDRAEAAALYAEYAMDYAVQTIQYALIAALSAMDLQMSVEETKGVS